MIAIHGGELSKEVVSSLVDIARDGFGTQITDEDARNHILKVDFLQLIISSAGNLIGFAGYDELKIRLVGGSVLYLSGIVIKQSDQNRGLGEYAIREAIEATEADALALRTQNPVMYYTARKILGVIYPYPGPRSLYPDKNLEACKHIASEIAKKLGMKNYQKENFIEQGTYGTSLNASVPEVDAYVTGKLFAELKIDRNRGDSMIVVGLPIGVKANEFGYTFENKNKRNSQAEGMIMEDCGLS